MVVRVFEIPTTTAAAGGRGFIPSTSIPKSATAVKHSKRYRSARCAGPEGNTVKNRSMIAVSAAALLLSACGAQKASVAGTSEASEPPATTSSSSSPSAVSSSPAASPAKGDKPTRDFVVGKWGTDGDCTLAIDLRPDGSSDGPFGAWAYGDGVISFPEEPEFKVNVTVVDGKTMQSVNDSTGKTTMMTRCP